jgi:hypothetical protein
MITLFARTTAAELVKLGGLPVVIAAALSTVVAFGAAGRGGTQVVPFLQIGPILLGVLAVSTEYAGRQIATTLTTTPDRLRLLTGKTVAYLIVATATSGAGLAAAWLLRPAPVAGSDRLDVGWPMAGAAAYLVLIGLLALGLAVVLRSLIPPLAGMLTLVLIVSPLLAGHTEHARWLPDRAGRLLYQPQADPLLTPVTGTVVLLTWIGLAAVAALWTFRLRDA